MLLAVVTGFWDSCIVAPTVSPPLRCTGSVPAGITHACTHALMHSCMHTYMYNCDCSNAQTCLRGQPHACMSMPHIHPSHIALTSSHIHHSDEPNAIIFIQVLALSHRAQVSI